MRGSRKQHIVDMTAARRANKQPVVYSVPAARLTLPSNMIHTLRIREIPAGDISTEITPPPRENWKLALTALLTLTDPRGRDFLAPWH